jgi:hypothetical protein
MQSWCNPVILLFLAATLSSLGASPTKSYLKFAYCFRRASLYVCPHVTTPEPLQWMCHSAETALRYFSTTQRQTFRFLFSRYRYEQIHVSCTDGLQVTNLRRWRSTSTSTAVRGSDITHHFPSFCDVTPEFNKCYPSPCAILHVPDDRSTNCPAAVSLFHCFSTLIQNLIYFGIGVIEKSMMKSDTQIRWR